MRGRLLAIDPQDAPIAITVDEDEIPVRARELEWFDRDYRAEVGDRSQPGRELVDVRIGIRHARDRRSTAPSAVCLSTLN
jgi:hypothetical protein